MCKCGARRARGSNALHSTGGRKAELLQAAHAHTARPGQSSRCIGSCSASVHNQATQHPLPHRRTAEAKRMVRLAKKRILAVDTECRAECSKGYLPVVFPLPELSPQPKAPRLGACAGNEHRCPSLREFTSHKMTSWFHPRRTTSAAERWLGCFSLEPRVLDDSVACMPHLVWAFVLKILRLSGFQWDRRSCAANRDVESLRDIAMRSLPRGCTLF